MTAIEAMKKELSNIKKRMAECETESGFIKEHQRYEYAILTRNARAFKESIEWLEDMYLAK